MSLIYSPEEDSYLLEKVLIKKIPYEIKNKSNLKFLEIGVGSGIQLVAVEKVGVKKENIFGVDLNLDAVKHCKNLGFNCFESDLLKNVQGKFDVVVFNPPYLPEDKEHEDEESKLITTGGEKGSEIINEFLIQAKEYLTKSGKIFLLISSLTKEINWSGYKKELVEEKKLFFEKLEVWELTFV